MSILEITELTQSTEVCHLPQKLGSKDKPLLSRDKHTCVTCPQTYIIKSRLDFSRSISSSEDCLKSHV